MSSFRKNFRHNLVPEIEMIDKIVDGKRYYFLPNGNKYKSVTTILGERLDKSGLLQWRARVGEEEANRISTQAARRGTAIHNMAERYVLNEEKYILEKDMPVNVVTFNSIKPILDKHVDTIFGVELPLYSSILQAAGRSDLIATFDGILSIVDFKTSRKLKKEEHIESYFIQTTAYSLMFEEIYSIKVPQLAIIIAVDNEEPQIFVKRTKDYYKRVTEVFMNFE